MGPMAWDPPDRCAPAPGRALNQLQGVCCGGAASLLVCSLGNGVPRALAAAAALQERYGWQYGLCQKLATVPSEAGQGKG